LKAVEKRGEKLSYRKVGIDRKSRKKSRSKIQSALFSHVEKYPFGKVIQLPFGILFPFGQNQGTYFDLQIEGVGTKTLLAELSEDYSSIGRDAVAMAANDVLRSGSRPVLLSDAIHIAQSQPKKVEQLISGVSEGAKQAGAILASGETGDVAEILHSQISDESPPFDLFVSCLGLASEKEIIKGSISPGDRIIGLSSSGIHSNGLTLARKVLLKKWGGKFDMWERPNNLERPLLEELLIPTRIYSEDLSRMKEEVVIKAAVHITGDGFAKFNRLVEWKGQAKGSNLGFTFRLQRKPPEIFSLIQKTAESLRQPISEEEMYKTFNMGYGFAIIVSKKESSIALELLGNKSSAQDIGYVSSTGRISLTGPDMEKPLLLD
jgi:phosphoribosylformylglycinamidine cyclo-ligase